MVTTQGCCVLFWSNTLQTIFVWPLTSHLMNHPKKTTKASWALMDNKRMNSSVMFSHGFLHMDSTSVSQPSKTYIHQFYMDTRCWLEDLPTVIAEREGLRERFKGILCCRHILMMISRQFIMKGVFCSHTGKTLWCND